MTGLGKMLMLVGGIIFIVGLLITFVKIGKLPGDIVIEKGNTTFYFPVMTSIVISIILSIIFFLVNRFR